MKYDTKKKFKVQTYSRVIETETEERQLKVEVFVDLLVGCVNVSLLVAIIFRTSLVEKPVHELTSNKGQALRRDVVASSIVAMRRWFAWSDTIHGIC